MLVEVNAHDDPVGKRLHRYVSEQLHVATAALELGGRESRHGVHQGRKAVRRARAALLLGWPRPNAGVALALDQLKRANDQLSDLRDANARVHGEMGSGSISSTSRKKTGRSGVF
ncbi:hypothetical protein [Lysobacter claricitrinus]|uniref:hypothetical protein n=1 Tax=Lysobacter claricitrinus TaxID=3367728 RepID=UPI0037DBE96C